jgi:hypothetical protein
MPLHSHVSRLRRVKRALLPTTLAIGLAACARPSQPGLAALSASGDRPDATAQAPPALRPANAFRPLSESEGELVAAAAVAAHEMRRP